MAKVVSCGVVMLNARREVFVCHTTGTARWESSITSATR